MERTRRGRGTGIVWTQSCGDVAAVRNYHCQSPQGREACGHAGRATDEIRVGSEPQDREVSRPHHPAFDSTARRRGDRMKRAIIRCGVAAFIATLTLPAAPLEAEAQHPAGKVRHIGLLHPGTPPNPNVEAFRQSLRDLGYVGGQNIVIEYRWAEGMLDPLPSFAAELVRLNVDVIVTEGTPGARALKEATSTIPIVMARVGDPVGTGLVGSLARPGR